MQKAMSIGAALALVTVMVYLPVKDYEFVNYDDPQYVADNDIVKAGVTWDGIKWAFGPNHWAWHPLSFVSHMIDCELFGDWAGGHHLTNVAFHAINVLLLLVVLHRMTGSLWCSAFVTALFGLHPLRVESVAWVTERKDVLSTFFGLLALWCYVLYTDKGGACRYAGVFVFMALSLLSKAMLVTLPFLLLLLDFWPLQRTRFFVDDDDDASNRKSVLSLFVEKLPLLLLTIGSCLMMLFVATSANSVASTSGLAIKHRLANVFMSYVNYLRDFFQPRDLAVLYAHPGSDWSMKPLVISIGLIAVVSLVAVGWLKRRPWFAVGWFWYLGTLVPVIGIVQAGDQARADRFTYVPLIGISIILAWGIAGVNRRQLSPMRKGITVLVAVLLLGVFTRATHKQLKHWRNSVALWTHTVSIDENAVSLYNLAGAYNKAGDDAAAIRYYRKVINEHRPDWVDARYILGSLLRKDPAKISEVIELYEQTLEKSPNAHEVLNALAMLRRDHEKKDDDAIALLERALDAEPEYFESLYNLGVMRIQRGEDAQAVELLTRAFAQKPNDIELRVALGKVLPRVDRVDEAHDHLSFALKRSSDHGPAHANMAIVMGKLGRLDESITHLRRRIEIGPPSADVHNAYGLILEKRQQIDDAIEQYETAIGIDPKHAAATAGLGRLKPS